MAYLHLIPTLSFKFVLYHTVHKHLLGRLGGSASWGLDFSSGHDLSVYGFGPHFGVCADSSEPGACCDSVSAFPAPPSRARSLSQK